MFISSGLVGSLKEQDEEGEEEQEEREEDAENEEERRLQQTGLAMELRIG